MAHSTEIQSTSFFGGYLRMIPAEHKVNKI